MEWGIKTSILICLLMVGLIILSVILFDHTKKCVDIENPDDNGSLNSLKIHCFIGKNQFCEEFVWTPMGCMDSEEYQGDDRIKLVEELPLVRVR